MSKEEKNESESELITWEDIELQSSRSTYLHRLVSSVKEGVMSKENALIDMVYRLDQTLEQVRGEYIDRSRREE